MIRINLLPEVYRRSERTSPKVFAATLAGVILACSSIGWFGLVYFGELGKLQVEHKGVQETLASVQVQAKYHDNLVKEREDFSKRADTIKNIAKGRMIWTKVMDDVITVVTNEGNSERHMGWFGSIRVKGTSAGSKKGPEMSMPGFVEGKDFRRVSNFHDDLEGANFYRDVLEGTPPSGVRAVDKDRFPQESYKFNLKWVYKPAQMWVKNNQSNAKPGK